LQSDRSLRFHHVDNDQMLCWSKRTADRSDVVLCVATIDPIWRQGGWVGLDLAELGLVDGVPYEVHDLLTGASYTWSGPYNYVELDAHVMPAHVFEVRRPPT
jgi:starch synthase (maltosyl-transferring)